MKVAYSSYFITTYKTTKLHDEKERKKEKKRKENLHNTIHNKDFVIALLKANVKF